MRLTWICCLVIRGAWGIRCRRLRHKAAITRLAPKIAEITADILLPCLSNLRLSLYDYQERLITDNLYAKVLAHLSDLPPVFQVNFTSLPAEAETFFKRIAELRYYKLRAFLTLDDIFAFLFKR